MQRSGDNTGDQFQNLWYCDAIDNSSMYTLMKYVSVAVSIFGRLHFFFRCKLLQGSTHGAIKFSVASPFSMYLSIVILAEPKKDCNLHTDGTINTQRPRT